MPTGTRDGPSPAQHPTASGAPEPVPFLDLAAQFEEIRDELEPALLEVLRTATFIGGPNVAAFETAYAQSVGVRSCVGVANGTDALELALRALGLGAGDEVILPANSFIATAEAVVRAGATPVFADALPDVLLLDPASAAAAVTDRTRAIVPVHLFGQVAPIERYSPIAEACGAVVVEDAAQAQGATRFGRTAGGLGAIAATSFYPGKNLGAAGDGGAVTTDDEKLADTVRTLAAHGSRTKYAHDLVGFNSRLDALQAVVLDVKLSRLPEWNARRRAAAAYYAELLGGIDEVVLPTVLPGNEDAWHLYVVRLDERDRVLGELAAAGIGAGIHYPSPIHRTPAFRDHPRTVPLTVSETEAPRLLSLPMSPHLTRAQQERVAEALIAAVRAG
ncbi:DegT/DnrJ/EryC1/StrS family aminotransferase [Agromyces lapidis]|uniref:DegT/DnrJ/EryC1/StrS family aminotransferase n=1 Tax=Agromyces lapidis TaxID=279574 RepID=A0ABV5SQN1_9MICO|nr:DegT/DnrJ/EryC1/StrS family aminotransferase [Agromyces lapidis]